MPRIKEITVSLDLTVQPKQYQSVKYGLTMVKQYDEADGQFVVADETNYLRELVGRLLRDGIRAEVEAVYGKAAAEYVVDQVPK